MRFRVASINLMAPAGPFLAWGERAKELAGLLSQRSPDLIGTQEATENSLDALKVQFPTYSVLGRGRWADGSGIQSALLINRDRFQVEEFKHFWFSHNPEKPGSKLPGMGSARVATSVVLSSEAGPLTWMNVHFSHLVRRAQAEIVLERLSRLPRPWLVTGDFNSTPFPPWSCHRVLSRELRDLSKSAGPTWNARVGLPLARLDWILGSEELSGLGCEVLREGKSDHWPVLADVDYSTETDGAMSEV